MQLHILFNVSFLSVFNHFKFNMYIAGLILIIPAAILSFILMKNFVFKTKIIKNDMVCPICGSSNSTEYKARFADFIAERVFDGENKDFRVDKVRRLRIFVFHLQV